MTKSVTESLTAEHLRRYSNSLVKEIFSYPWQRLLGGKRVFSLVGIFYLRPWSVYWHLASVDEPFYCTTLTHVHKLSAYAKKNPENFTDEGQDECTKFWMSCATLAIFNYLFMLTQSSKIRLSCIFNSVFRER